MKPKPISEVEFQAQVTDLCDLLGYRWHHETDSRKSKKGFPDLVIVTPTAVVFAELKTDDRRSKLRPDQRDWLMDLRRAGAHAYVWRPRMMPEIATFLRSLSV